MSGPLSSFGTDDSPHARVTNSLPKMRRFYTMSLTGSGDVHEEEIRAPATPDFEAAFNALAHGSLIATRKGEVAIEDLRPGMEVISREHGLQTVLWVGIMTHQPEPGNGPLLTRVTSDRFGPGQPSPDLLAGPGARLLHRPAGIQFEQPGKMAYSPLRDFIDGDTVIGISPRGAVDTYHVCVERHGSIRAGGLDLETFHPGRGLQDRMGPHTRELFLSMFPHLRSLAEFGALAHPRMARARTGAGDYA